jgi:hypothetical protein
MAEVWQQPLVDNGDAAMATWQHSDCNGNTGTAVAKAMAAALVAAVVA